MVFSYEGGWYLSHKKTETRKIICKYLQDIRAYNEFLGMRYVHSGVSPDPDDPDIMSLYEVLFKPDKEKTDKEKINFQNLIGAYGAKVAYKTFFLILISRDRLMKIGQHLREWEKKEQKGKVFFGSLTVHLFNE